MRPVIAIVAVSETGIIGNAGKVPWTIPSDVRQFRERTTGSTVIMGRTTHEEIGGPLPNRNNIIFTNQPGYKAPGCKVAASVVEALQIAQKFDTKEIYVIGGAQTFQAFMPVMDYLYVSRVHVKNRGDTVFKFGPEWHERSKISNIHEALDEYSYDFIIYSKK